MQARTDLEELVKELILHLVISKDEYYMKALIPKERHLVYDEILSLQERYKSATGKYYRPKHI